jgi:hypothetical protein
LNKLPYEILSFLVLKDYICKNTYEMIIERTKKEVIIKLLPSVNTDELQELANFFRYKEITSKYTTQQDTVDELSSEINKNWYKTNRDRLLK